MWEQHTVSMGWDGKLGSLWADKVLVVYFTKLFPVDSLYEEEKSYNAPSKAFKPVFFLFKLVEKWKI